MIWLLSSSFSLSPWFPGHFGDPQEISPGGGRGHESVAKLRLKLVTFCFICFSMTYLSTFQDIRSPSRMKLVSETVKRSGVCLVATECACISNLMVSAASLARPGRDLKWSLQLDGSHMARKSFDGNCWKQSEVSWSWEGLRKEA